MTLRDVLETLPDEATLPVSFVRRLLAEGMSPETTQDRPTMLSVRETAARIGMSQGWVYDNAEELGCVRYGRSVRFPVAAVEQYQERDR